MWACGLPPPLSFPLSPSLYLSHCVCVRECDCISAALPRYLPLCVSTLRQQCAWDAEGGVERGSDNGDGDGNGSDILRHRVAWLEATEVAREQEKGEESGGGEAAIGGQSVVCSAKEQFALSMRGQRNCFVACDTFEYPAKEATLPIPEYGMRWPHECSSTRDGRTYC